MYSSKTFNVCTTSAHGKVNINTNSLEKEIGLITLDGEHLANNLALISQLDLGLDLSLD